MTGDTPSSGTDTANLRSVDRLSDRIVSRLKLRQLRLLMAVGQHRSVLHAARALNVSQPAASKLIQDLEADFGVPLFDRTNRGVVPTAFGAALIRHARLVLTQIGQAAAEISDLSAGRAGRVVVGTLLAASARLLPDAIARVRQDRPGIGVKIVEGTNDILMPALRAGELDLVLGRLSAHRHRAELVQERLHDEAIQAVARPGHPLTLGRPTLAAVLAHGLILPPPETTLRRQIDQMYLDAGLSPPQPAVESVAWLANREILAATDLVGLVPAEVAARDIAAGLVAALDWPVPLAAGPVGVTMRAESGLSPAAEVFLTALRACAAARPRA